MRPVALVLACLAIPGSVYAHGHRAEAAPTYAKLWASNESGFGASVALPLCWLKIGGVCEHNDFSLVVAFNRLEGEHEVGGETKDAKLRIYLAGVRYTFNRVSIFSPFVHVLGGFARGLETAQGSNVDPFEGWRSGAAVTVTAGVEVEVKRYVRLRAQYGGALFRLGDDTRGGQGLAFAIAVGNHPEGHPHH